MSLYCGDAAQILPLLPPADLLLTDPPYGIGIAREGGIGYRNRKGVRRYAAKDWDQTTPPEWLLGMALSRARRAIVWGGCYLGLGRATCSLIWDKQNDGLSFSQAEIAWTNLPAKGTRIFRLPMHWAARSGVQRIHPTQKPVPLLQWCLSKVPAAKSILDPFAGSAATLEAAMRAGLPAIGIEREPDYCAAAAARLEAVAQELRKTRAG